MVKSASLSGQVDGAALQAHDHAVHALDDLKGDLVQIGRGAPVLVELLQHHVVLRGAGHKLVGAGADGEGAHVGVVGGDDGGSHVGQELVARLLQSDHHSAVVGGGDGVDDAQRGHQRLALALVGAALQRVDDVVDGHSVAVMEFHALTQGEGVGQSVGGDLVVLGHGADQLAGGVGLHQTLVDVEHDLTGAGRVGVVGVEGVVQVLRDAHDDLVGALAGVLGGGCGAAAGACAAAQYAAGQNGRENECQNSFFHAFLLLFHHRPALCGVDVDGTAGTVPARQRAARKDSTH